MNNVFNNMKPLFIALLALPQLVAAQYEFLKLENTQVFFEKVYQVDSSTASDIEKLLVSGLPKVKDFRLGDKMDGLITGNLVNTYIDYKRYGGKWGGLPPFMNYPFFADVSISWKEGKYKVSVSNMYFNTTGFGLMKCSDILTKSRGTIFHPHPNIVAAGGYIEKYLSDLFTIKPSNSDW